MTEIRKGRKLIIVDTTLLYCADLIFGQVVMFKALRVSSNDEDIYVIDKKGYQWIISLRAVTFKNNPKG